MSVMRSPVTRFAIAKDSKKIKVKFIGKSKSLDVSLF